MARHVAARLQVAPQGVADRVLLGLLPSSKGGWATALAALKPQGGFLHLHENVKVRPYGVGDRLHARLPAVSARPLAHATRRRFAVNRPR